MRKMIVLIACLLVFNLARPLAHAATAKLGDPASALTLSEWVKGTPVKLADLKGKQVVVVEFWATWCGPCLQSIPHLTELQTQFKDKGVTFIGVSNEQADVVKPFVEKMGDKMAYNVVVDKDNKTFEAYMAAFDRNGIPNAFVVDRAGQIVWEGHPMETEMVAAITEALKPEYKFDPSKIVKKPSGSVPMPSQKLQKGDVLSQIYQAMQTYVQDPEGEKVIGELLLKYADTADPIRLRAVLTFIVNDSHTEDAGRNYALAAKLGKVYVEKVKDPDARTLEAYAKALEKTGQTKEAAEIKKQAETRAAADAKSSADSVPMTTLTTK